MSFQFLNAGRTGDIQEVTPIDTFIDPVSKIRVSNPSNLIDTDFEYGLQPTKWETVELINNTPAFFSRGGDTTIPDITGITTNAGTREITVTTAFAHNLDVGIPIRVAGTKSVTADGSYIINATPTPTTFTYLSRANQAETISIFDLYTSIISGEFFQGSQISISDAEGIITDGDGPVSTLTIKTENKHGFGPNTPFYFLNLNSTISQEFESQNTASVSFDPTNSATAQEFDGSNTLLQTPVDLSNSATTSTEINSIQTTNTANASFTISINATNESRWESLVNGDPLYYDITAGSGYFQANPRGVVFIKDTSSVDIENNVATFQVSALPDGDAIPVIANIQGFFQVADQARTFAGNNVNEETQIDITVEVGQNFVFDGGNRGYDGDPENPPNGTGTVIGYTGTTINLFTAEGSLDYYVGAMLKYESDGDDATGLESDVTYFVTAFAPGQSSGLFTMSIAPLPGGNNISIAGGSGTQTFSKIGISLDKNIFHIRDSNFQAGDLLQYFSPEGGAFQSNDQKEFYFATQAYDSHNYILSSSFFTPTQATGGVVTEVEEGGSTYKVHTFSNIGTSTFSISQVGSDPFVEVYAVGAGGGGGQPGGWSYGAHAGGGGYAAAKVSVEEKNYLVMVGGRGVNAGTGGSLNFTQGGGAPSKPNSSDNRYGGQGGGLSGFFDNATYNSSNAILIAGGGGGGGSARAWEDNKGGAGGGFSGQDGQAAYDGRSSYRGRGGGQTGPTPLPTNGNNPIPTQFNGGVTASYGGGGGGGWWGGSAGTYVESNTMAGGGGGSSYAKPQVTSDVLISQGNRRWQGTSNNNETRSQVFAAERGLGGGISVPGENGQVVIKYPITLPEPRLMVATGGQSVSDVSIGGILYRQHIFTSVASNQFIVNDPGTLGKVEVIAWGAGGGRGGTSGPGRWGGGGGYAKSVMTLTSGTYIASVGGGGGAASTACVTNTGRGAPGTGPAGASGGFGWNAASSGCSGAGGGGGAGSLFLRDGVILLAAAGGGGGSGSESGGGTTNGVGGGGGQNGQSGNARGGEFGRENSTVGRSGGGLGGDRSGGGGGGGGLRGGDYGYPPGSDGVPGGGGGGGSSFGQIVINGNLNTPANASDPLRNGAGRGGDGTNRSGGNGIIVIRYPIDANILDVEG